MLLRLRGVRSMPWRREIVGKPGQKAILARAILRSQAVFVRCPTNSTAYRQSPALSVKIATSCFCVVAERLIDLVTNCEFGSHGKSTHTG
jgi:hypothetical protein